MTEKESAGLAEKLIANRDKGELATAILPPGEGCIGSETVAKLLADFVIAKSHRWPYTNDNTPRARARRSPSDGGGTDVQPAV